MSSPQRPPAVAVRAVNLVLIGVLTGAMFEEYLLLRYIVSDLPAETWGALHARFALVHPFTIIPIAVLAVLSLAAIFVVERDFSSTRARLTLVGAVCSLGIGLLTALVMMPANEAIQAWSTAGVPQDWAEVRDRWTTLQGVRALLSLVGFAPLCLAAQTPRP